MPYKASLALELLSIMTLNATVFRILSVRNMRSTLVCVDIVELLSEMHSLNDNTGMLIMSFLM